MKSSMLLLILAPSRTKGHAACIQVHGPQVAYVTFRLIVPWYTCTLVLSTDRYPILKYLLTRILYKSFKPDRKVRSKTLVALLTVGVLHLGGRRYLLTFDQCSRSICIQLWYYYVSAISYLYDAHLAFT